MTAPDYTKLRARLERRDPFIYDRISLKPRLYNPDGPEASTAIAELQAQVEAMREALVGAVASLEWWQRNEPASFGNIEAQRLEAARAALQPKDQSNG